MIINFVNVFSLFSIFISLILSLIILFRGSRITYIQLIFGLCGIGVSFWIVANFFAEFFKENPTLLIFFTRLAFIPATILPLLFLYFSHLFYHSDISYAWNYKYLILRSIPTVILLMLTPLSAEITEENNIPSIKFGLPYWFLIVYFILYIGQGLFLLYKKKKETTSKTLISQINFILYGVFLTGIGGLIFNAVLPLLGEQRFLNLGPAFSFFFVLFSFYAIIQHHLFNIKVIATEIFTLILILILFINIFSFSDLGQLIFNIILFLSILIFSFFLIKSIWQEVKTREGLENLNQAKSEFISIVSHQLRTPLTVIKGYLSMILEEDYGSLPPKIKPVMENVLKSNERLIKMVNAILNISKIESGRMDLNLEKVDLIKIIEEVIEELKVELKQKNLYLKFEKPPVSLPHLLIDKEKIREVIVNIIENSIHYTKEGGITIKLEKFMDRLRIIISDTGAGMTREDISKIFESFSRGKAGTKLYTEGAGLGLYIARKFVEMNNGKIWAESEGLDKGSRFFIELPIK